MDSFAPSRAGWDGILAADERLLWQGRPQAGFDWLWLWHKKSIVGVMFMAFAVAWIGLTWRDLRADGDPFLLIFPLAGLLFFGLGLNLLAGVPLRRYGRLKRTTYSLSDRRAFIAVASPGKSRLEEFSLATPQRPVLEDGEPGSIWFDLVLREGAWNGAGAAKRYGPNDQAERIGFERIAEARRVYGLLVAARNQLIEAARANPPPDLPPPPPAS